MQPVLKHQQYALDLEALYARMWSVSEDCDDGTRIYRPRPGSGEALKWRVAELAGTPVDKTKSMTANNSLRGQAHARLVELGWADRLTPSSFRLLVRPQELSASPAAASGAPEDPEDSGVPVEGVDAEAVTDESSRLVLASLDWSEWMPLAKAALQATKSPGVYVARSGGQIVYVGMAGERRGQGVRGRLKVYARGRGAVSGLGEAALDRALADEEWVEQRLLDLRQHGPRRSKLWAADALERIPIDVCWTAASSASQAEAWERAALEELADLDLWNRARPGSRFSD